MSGVTGAGAGASGSSGQLGWDTRDGPRPPRREVVPRRLTAGGVVSPAGQPHPLLGAGAGVLQEHRAGASQPLGACAQHPLTQGHERPGVHQGMAAGEHGGRLQKLALLPQALREGEAT